MRDAAVEATSEAQLRELVGKRVLLQGIAYQGKGRDDLRTPFAGFRVAGPWIWPESAVGKRVAVVGILRREEIVPQEFQGIEDAVQTESPEYLRQPLYYLENIRCTLSGTDQEVKPASEDASAE